MAAVVLVHGLYHRPEHFALVAERMRTAWAVGLLRAQAPGCGRGIPERHSWKHAPSTYVVCAQDRAIDPGLQRRMASRWPDVREWQTGHSPCVGQPDLVVELLQELLAATIPPR